MRRVNLMLVGIATLALSACVLPLPVEPACYRVGDICCEDNRCEFGLVCRSGFCQNASLVPVTDVGADCREDFDCESGLCLGVRVDERGFLVRACSAVCNDSSQCVPGWFCDHPSGLSGMACLCTGEDERCDGKDNDCDGQVDESSDESCMASYGDASRCVSGACQCLGEVCDGRCVDTVLNPNHCGSCGRQCELPATGEAACVAQRCGRIDTLGTGTTTTFGIAADTTNIYWIKLVDGGASLIRTPQSGAPETTLVDGLRTPSGLFDFPYRILVDGTHVYWSDTHAATIQRVPIEGGSAETIVSGLDTVQGFSIDATHAYWAGEIPVSGDDNTIFGNLLAIPLGGGQPTTLVTEVLFPMATASDGERVFWMNLDGEVFSVSVMGGEPVKLASPNASRNAFALFDRIAVDATHVYWAVARLNETTGVTTAQLVRTPKLGGDLKIVSEASGELYHHPILDGDNIYWLSQKKGVGNRVLRASKSGGLPTILTSMSTLDFTVDPDGIDVLKNDAVRRVLPK